MIDYQIIREAVRKRVINATGIDPQTQFQAENSTFDPVGKELWIAEECIGGAEQMMSVKRSRIPSFLIQYNLYVPVNTGVEIIDKAVNTVFEEFDLADADKSNITAGNYDIIIKNIKRDISYNSEWRCDAILFTIDVCSLVDKSGIDGNQRGIDSFCQ